MSLQQRLAQPARHLRRRPRIGATPGPLSEKCFSFFRAGGASTAAVGTKCPTPMADRLRQPLLRDYLLLRPKLAMWLRTVPIQGECVAM